MKTHDERKGYKIILAFYNRLSKPERIGFRSIQARTGLSTDAIIYWLRYLKEKHLVGKIESANHKDRKYYLTYDIVKKKDESQILEMLIDSRSKKKKQKSDSGRVAMKRIGRPSIQEKEAAEVSIRKRDKIKFHLLYLAGLGVTFETVLSENREFHTKPIKITPSTEMKDLLLNQIISSRPYTKVNDILLDTTKGVT